MGGKTRMVFAWSNCFFQLPSYFDSLPNFIDPSRKISGYRCKFGDQSGGGHFGSFLAKTAA